MDMNQNRKCALTFELSRMSGGLLVHKEIIDSNMKYISRTCINKLKYAHFTFKTPPKGHL